MVYRRQQQIFVLIIGWLQIVNCQDLFEGDSCSLPSGYTGQCTLLPNCPDALEKIKKRINPQICTFKGKVPVVCCETIQVTFIRWKPKKPGDVSAKKCRDYANNQVQFDARLNGEERCSLSNNLIPTSQRISEPVHKNATKVSSNSTEPQIADDDIEYVIGGTSTSLGQYPHVAAIGYGDESNIQWRCTGSLISEQWILTAAHCTAASSLGVANWTLLGAVELYSPFYKFRIEKRIKHPFYTRTSYYHDIALMKLETRVTFLFSMRPACLRVEPDIEEYTAIAGGWGVVDWRTQQTSNILQTVYLDIYNKSICDHVFEGDVKLASGMNEQTQLCIGALEGGRDTCNGDSGGGVLEFNSREKCIFDIVGVTSVGSRFCGTPNSVGLYTKVFNYLDWIERIVWPEFFD